MPQPYLLADSQIANLFRALGVDGQTLLFNTMAFLLVVAILTHFVYPTLIRALDAKKLEFETAARLEQEAKQHIASAEQQASDIIKEARSQAHEITAAARKDASERQASAEAAAAAKSKRIVQNAHEQLARDILIAREALRSETAHLVASASSRLMNMEITEDNNAQLIRRSLEEHS